MTFDHKEEHNPERLLPLRGKKEEFLKTSSLEYRKKSHNIEL